MIGLILTGFLLSSASAASVADLVVSCSLLEEGSVGMKGGVLFSRTEATLVLRDVPIGGEVAMETLTPFVPPTTPDPQLLLLEATVSSPQIPQAELLLQADCSQQEVTCELSHYSPPRDSDSVYFLVSLSVEEAGFSTALILKTIPLVQNNSTLIQTNLDLPLSPAGTLLTEVVFLMFSTQKTVSAPLRADILLHCAFRQRDGDQDQDLDDEDDDEMGNEEEEDWSGHRDLEVEWRVQHRGQGQKVLGLKTRMAAWEENTDVVSGRTGSSVDAGLLVSEGDASLRLTSLKVLDQGTYICSVRVGRFQAQQVVQLYPQQAPSVSMTEEKLKSHHTLSCHSSQYYPLDVQMDWFSLSPSALEPEPLGDQGSLSSHLQHADGTYSLSAHLAVPPSTPPGTNISCRVTHRALDAPLYTIATVERHQEDSYLWVLGFLIITVLFFYQVMK